VPKFAITVPGEGQPVGQRAVHRVALDRIGVAEARIDCLRNEPGHCGGRTSAPQVSVASAATSRSKSQSAVVKQSPGASPPA
jgi:hypothetical protein